HAKAAASSDDLLTDTKLLVAAVKASRQLTIPGRVGLHVGVHQVERHPADVDLPDRNMDGPAIQVDLDCQALAIREEGRADRRVGGDERNGAGLLPTAGRDTLAKVAMRAPGPEADQEDGRLAVLH